MTYLTNRLAYFWNWVASLLLALAFIVLSWAFFPTLSNDNKAITAYESSPYNYCLVDDSSFATEQEFFYFNGKKPIFLERDGTSYSEGLLNFDLFMQKESSSFTLNKVLDGKEKLGPQEIGLTENLMKRHGLSLGDEVYFSKISEPVFVISAVYSDCYGIFDVSYYGDFGYMVIGYNGEAVSLEHSYAAFTVTYDYVGFGPKTYIKGNYLVRLHNESTLYSVSFAVSSSLLALAISMIFLSPHLFGELPKYRLHGYRSQNLLIMVFENKFIVYLLPILAWLIFTILLGYDRYCLLFGLTVLLGTFLIDYLISGVVALTRRK